MATSIASNKPIMASAAAGTTDDPFITSPSGPTHFRHSRFDGELFALSPGASAEQVRRAIEAHLRDTDRRLEEAGKLGTALVQQRKELTDRLRDVEQLQSEAELSPELRQRLVDIEKDYNEVAGESARAFLPKQRVPSNEAVQGSPFPPEGKGGRRSVSPSKFESLATGSPTKLSVPNRKLRNQPANRVHDIEFAAEISTSLIAQVRSLQAVLAERDQELKDLKTEKSKLELETEGFQQRVKALDESENRYKDENWNLETQLHDLIAKQKDAADREKKLQQTLSVLQAEKNATQRELEEVKDALAKQDEKHAVAIKNLEIELGTSRRTAVMAESERVAMQKKVEELTSQNQELAKAFSMQRGRALERESGLGMSDEDLEAATDNATPEHSPPPSPVKGTPRHSVLESETLKTSLGHAQRTIQTLRTNIHREKTEKLELKRMLQDARDELEKTRADPNGSSNRRSRKVDSREFKKPFRLGQLGGARLSKTELLLDDANWEDQQVDAPSPRSLSMAASPSPGSSFSQRMAGSMIPPIAESGGDHFETANETSDAAFETAHERATETEDFQTGAEELSDDDDDDDDDGGATETEASPSRGASRIKRPPVLPMSQSGYRYSFESTASTSNDEDDYGFGTDLKTPTAQPPQKLRLRVSRGGALNSRRSRQASEEPTLQSSPASFAISSTASTPQQQQQQPQHQLPPHTGQSLFAELGDYAGSDDDSFVSGATPSRRSIRSVTPGSFARGRPSSPPPEVPALPLLARAIMVDSGMMTEPVQIASPAPIAPATPRRAEAAADTAREQAEAYDDEEADAAVVSPRSAIFLHSLTGRLRGLDHGAGSWLADDAGDGERSRPVSAISYSDASVQHDNDLDAKLAQFPSPPTSPPQLGLVPTPILRPPPSLRLSSMRVEDIEPEADRGVHQLSGPLLTVAPIISLHVEPISEPEPAPPEPPSFSLTALLSEHIEPESTPVEPPPALSVAPLLSQHVEPQAEPEVPLPVSPTLSISTIVSQHVEPVAAPGSLPPALSISAICAQQLEPVEPAEPATPVLVLPTAAESQAEDEAGMAMRPVLAPLSLSSILAEHVEPRDEPALLPNPLSLAPIHVQEVEPRQETEAMPPVPPLSLTSICSQHIEPSEATENETPVLQLSAIQSQDIEPILPEAPAVPPTPLLGLSSIQAVGIEPMAPRSPARDAFMLPRDNAVPGDAAAGSAKHKTPEELGWDPRYVDHGWMWDGDTAPGGATRRDPASGFSVTHLATTAPTTKHQGAQTVLTAEALDKMAEPRPQVTEAASSGAGGLLERPSSPGSVGTPSTVRHIRSREGSFDRSVPRPVWSRGKMTDIGETSDTALPLRRPGSAASSRAPLRDAPPLPANHKEAIEAARTGSSSGGQGTIGLMGPPLFPASALRNQNPPAFRPRTPTVPQPMSPISMTASGRGTPTPRAGGRGGGSVYATSDVHSPSRLTHFSKSSVSSFASELESRFNMQDEVAFGDVRGFSPSSDPRMIQAITQTMIGEYLWKYTRKAGRGELSERRHRRYFWVHPYTRTLYWSDRDPGDADNRSEVRAKSVPIEAVRVVTDDNPMPPGLHRKSLLVISPGRTIKFTCTTGQRHETWFNALSYLLLRTDNEGQSDAEEMAENMITREDVDEFNPSLGKRPAIGTRPPAPASVAQHSMSSYRSRGVRNESPAVDLSMSLPTLTPTTAHRKAPQHPRQSFATLSRISGYWKDSKVLSGTFSSLRGRSVSRSSQREPISNLYGATDDAHDSAEDLRQFIERMDRESDRLENVRACCDGKHDVGTLTASGRRSRHPRTNGHGDGGPSRVASTTPTPMGTWRSRS
ncbi:anucleate primary sterigmata protein A [Diplogelasinospora grovesii]|uniref:Anucleate primary sterigmata protein A n=1 Tax=Diplogelasinospora grovesii TaxID=303347 RepID=A0AAN6S8S9_9PEZI|nr:anucleate primary sterigmata protein A [Diplogelasinospora grovesii]